MPDSDRPLQGDRPAPSLRTAVRRARVENAERAQVTDDLRIVEMARLDLLFDALRPVLAQVPDEIDLFDAGVMPGERPRLFVDMIAFIEMDRDGRVYRFCQDARHGRVVLAESLDIDTIVTAVTNYIARRLIEREKALASDALHAAGAIVTPVGASVSARPPRRRGRIGAAVAFVLEIIGALVVALITLVVIYAGARAALGG